MKERIKQIRKRDDLTQTAFGEKLGVKGNTVTGWETGIRTPSDAIITSICREFHVSENWLRTGEGNMEQPVDEDQEMADFFAQIYHAPKDDPYRRAVAVLQRLNRNCPGLFPQVVNAVVEEFNRQQKTED